MRSFFTLPNFFYGIEDECCEIYCGFFDLFLYVRLLVPSFSPLHRNAAAAASCLPINPAESNPALLFLGSAIWLISIYESSGKSRQRSLSRSAEILSIRLKLKDYHMATYPFVCFSLVNTVHLHSHFAALFLSCQHGELAFTFCSCLL